MAKIADVLYKTTASVLGGITVLSGLWVGATFFSMYSNNRQIQERHRVAAVSSEDK